MHIRTKKKHGSRIFWIGGLGLLPSLVGYFLLVMPQQNMRKSIQDQIERVNTDFSQTLESAETDSRHRILNTLQSQQEELERFVIDVSEESGLALDISQMAQERELSTFSSQRKTDQLHVEIPTCEKIEESNINITFQSSFPQFAQFVNALERHRPIIFIDKFSIFRSGRAKSTPETAMTLSVLVCEGKEAWVDVASLVPGQNTVSEEVDTKEFPVETILSSQENVYQR